MMLGRTDEVDGHFIATRFVGLLVPTESVYFAERGGRAKSPAERLRIPIDWRSVALGVGRLWLPILAVALPVAQVVLQHGQVRLATCVASAIFLALAVAAHRGGRLPDEAKDKLRLLGTVTGFRIDPARLRPETRHVKRDSLGELMDKAGIPLSAEGILSILEDIPVPAMPLVYGYARYAGDEPLWQDCAELVYQRYQQSEM